MRCKLFLLYIFSLISLLLILGCFGISVYAWISYKLVDSLNQSWFFIIMLTFAGLAGFYIIVSIIGAYGVYERKQNYVYFYSVLVFICTLVYLAGAIAAIKLPPLIKRGGCVDGDIFNSIQQAANASIYNLCYNCPCYIPQQTLQSTYNPLIIQSFSIYSPQISTTNPSLPIKTQDCGNWNKNKYNEFSNILESLETNLKCSGWCKNTNSLFYRFSNVSNGIPMNTCYEQFETFVGQGGVVVEVLFFVLTGISIFKLLVSCLVDVEEQDGDSEAQNYQTDAQGQAYEEKSNVNVILAQKRVENYPYFQPKYNQYELHRYNL